MATSCEAPGATVPLQFPLNPSGKEMPPTVRLPVPEFEMVSVRVAVSFTVTTPKTRSPDSPMAAGGAVWILNR